MPLEPPPPPAPTNDNLPPWQQGHADGKAGRWSEILGEQGDTISQTYLAGWIAAQESPAD